MMYISHCTLVTSVVANEKVEMLENVYNIENLNVCVCLSNVIIVEVSDIEYDPG